MFSRIPLGVRKILLHGGGVTSCGTYGHQSGQQVIPPTASSADPLCSKGSRWASFRCCFLLKRNNSQKEFVFFKDLQSDLSADDCNCLGSDESSSCIQKFLLALVLLEL